MSINYNTVTLPLRKVKDQRFSESNLIKRFRFYSFKHISRTDSIKLALFLFQNKSTIFNIELKINRTFLFHCFNIKSIVQMVSISKVLVKSKLKSTILQREILFILHTSFNYHNLIMTGLKKNCFN